MQKLTFSVRWHLPDSTQYPYRFSSRPKIGAKETKFIFNTNGLFAGGGDRL
jgi:hypothetical protein